MCFRTEHKRGATLSELEFEAEPLYETVYEQMGLVGKNKRLTSLSEGQERDPLRWLVNGDVVFMT